MSALWEADELAAGFGADGPGFAITGISIDTRTLQPGDLFVALSGERDGHDFVSEALAKGAAGALVSRPISGPMEGRLLVVADTLAALARLGAASRARSRAKIVAVTGSVGKTTAKEMLRTGLSTFGRVHAAEASFNNHIGVPLTLARMKRDTDFGVFEIGMNHPGEILPLAELVQPDVALITHVGRSHLGLMGSEAAIAAEKASLFTSLRPGGVAVMPGESAFLPLLRSKVPAGVRQIAFGTEDARILKMKAGAQASDISASIGRTGVKFHLDAPGMHMAMNAIAVLASIQALGLDVADAAAALEDFAPFTGRGARREISLPGGGHVQLLDESYNASSSSIRAAFAVLALQPGRHVAALGDMLELGEAAQAEHLSLLPDAVAGADLVFTCGPWMKVLFDSLPRSKQGAHAQDAASLAPLVKSALRAGDTLLVKGSYGSRMRDVISHLESPA
jgi:UDP-N-acetylmuramoyl-tripeptide--D-alanyl-D-alanine ligase